MTNFAVSQNLLRLIKTLEGFCARPYICSGGFTTIGYGHRIFDTKSSNLLITEHEAQDLLIKDILQIKKHLYKNIFVPLKNYQLDALISLIFNIGVGAFIKSILITKINAKLFSDAAEEFLKWIYIRKNISKALIRRRKIERTIFLGLEHEFYNRYFN